MRKTTITKGAKGSHSIDTKNHVSHLTGVATKAHERKKLERQQTINLGRYIARPPVAEKRLSLTKNGMVRYQLKPPYHDGTTHVVFEPLDFISKLAALVSKPRVNLTRYHGVFAPNSKYRALVTPIGQGKAAVVKLNATAQDKSSMGRRAPMNWAQ